MKKNFKIGDRVRCIKKFDGNSTIKNKVGTVRHIKTLSGYIGVEFDKEIRGHDLEKHIKRENGWYVLPDCLKPVDEKIVIFQRDNEVIAINTATDKKGVARCNPEDTFDFKTGAKLALERLTSDCIFKILCIKDTAELMKKGKIYEFIDGVTKWEDDTKSDCYTDFNHFCRRNSIISKNVIEIKDGDNVDELLKQYDPIKKGDMVTVISTGQTYSRYESWKGLKGYESHFVNDKKPVENYVYKVINVRKHNTDSSDVALIQDMNTTQVFIIGIDGLKKR